MQEFKNKFMKAILIFTAALMTGASIYGVASYKQLAGTKDFKELYTEKKESPRSEAITTKVASEKKESAITEIKKPQKKIAVNRTTKRRTATLKKEEVKADFIIVEQPATALKEESAIETKEELVMEAKEEAAPNKEQTKKVKKLKRNMFSRARISNEE